MYVIKEDFAYFESLFKTLDEARRQKFLELLKMAGSERAKVDVSKIVIIDKVMLSEWTIEPHEMVTRTMIKKAYKAAKDG